MLERFTTNMKFNNIISRTLSISNLIDAFTTLWFIAWTGEVVAKIPTAGEFSAPVARHDTAVYILEPDL